MLGSGFLEANPDLSAQLKSGEINLTEWFNELLRLVYRLIFLMVAEDRNLLHPEKAKLDARKLYAELVERYPDSQQTPAARKRLEALGPGSTPTPDQQKKAS